MNRRTFLKASALAFSFVPSRAFGADAATRPSRKLNIAGIGIGGQGGADLSNMETENIVALCDVDANHAAHTFKRYPNAKVYKDYRKMLDEVKEIEAVVVGTPDHMHAFASMAAMHAGKHVYCEKPLTHSVWEARQVAQFAREKKLMTQMGNQGQASTETRLLCERAWSGIIGPIHEAHIWTDRPSQGLFAEYWPQGVARPKEEPPVPATLDWDLWIGPAPLRPYNPAYLPFKWRGWWDFGTGALGDIGCHAFDPVFRALRLGHPISVEAASTRVNTETYPLGSMVTYRFPARKAEVDPRNVHVRGLSGPDAGASDMPALKLTWYDGGLRPPRPQGLPEGVAMGDNGRLLVGEKGFILGNSVWMDGKHVEVPQKPRTIPASVGHYKEFIDACKGGLSAGSNFDWAGPLAEVVLLGNIALRVQLREALTQRPLLWDPAGLRITNLDVANQFIRREYRQGWSL
ncbi:MAG: Gfo/Idh/MocA family oxidoreductase [Tepidisphaeraceae bacterium]